MRTDDKTANVSEVDATLEVNVKEGSPLASNLDDVNISFVDLEPLENHTEAVEFIWDELAKRNTVEMKVRK